MKALILGLCLCSASLLYAHSAKGQSMKTSQVELHVQHIPLKEVLRQLSQQSGIQFTYKSVDINPYRDISYQASGRPLEKVLNDLLRPKGLGFEQLQNTVIIKPLKDTPSLRDTAATIGSVQEIKGRIVDERGNPLPGVNVRLKGFSSGVATDEQGQFSLKQLGSGDMLVLTFLGFKTKEVPLAQLGNSGSLTMEPDPGLLDEVMVIAYGTTSKRLSTGSTAAITAKDIASQPVGDPLAALQGRIAGLEIASSSGMSASNFSVRIRGVNSIGSKYNPLYIVDGVPFISEPLNGFTGANGQQSPLASINPADIERIDVLKDADATAIYGSRGANGVILITTKKGKAGKTQTSFDLYSGIGKVSHQVDMLSTPEYLALRREAFSNDGVDPASSSPADLFEWDQQKTTDWQDLLLGNTAHFSQANMSVSGGNELTSFLMSGTYRHEGSVMPGNSGYDKGAGRLSIDHTTANRVFQVTASIGYTGDQNNTLPTDLTQYYNLPPNMPIYDEQGNYYWYGNAQNPLAFLERTYESKTKSLIANGTLRLTPVKNLHIQANLGYTDTRMNQLATYPEKGFNPSTSPGSYSNFNTTTNNSYILEPQVDYTLNRGKHELQVLAGGTWQQSVRELTWLQASGFASDGQLDNIQAASELATYRYTYAKYNYQAFFARATYNWDKRYLLNVSFRRDGSSRFGPNHRFGNFGAVGAGWVFSETSFVKEKLPFLSFGKLRGSYGVTGNDQIGDYQFLDSWEYVPYPYDGIAGLSPARVYNPDYSWERNKKLEVGLEIGALKDRISLTTNYYRNRSDSQLLDFVLSPQTGFDGYITNLPALVQNKGWEFELHTVNIQRKDFSWNSSLNMTIPSNKLLKYPGLIGSANESYYAIGYPLTITKGYLFTGVDPTTGISQFADKDGDGALVAGVDDQYVLGSDIPKFYGGFQNSLHYKNWELDVFFQFVKQEGPQLNYGYSASNAIGIMVNFDRSVQDRWQEPNQQTDVPKSTASSSSEAYSSYNNRYRLSSALWGDASYLRLKTASLRYDFTQALKALKVPKAVVYLQGSNLFTITGYEGFDPETQGMVMPPLRLYTLGLQFTL